MVIVACMRCSDMRGYGYQKRLYADLWRREQLVVSRNRRRRYSSYCGEIGPAPDNLIARNFKAEQPNQKWLTVITDFQLPAGKVWLSPIVDCFDAELVNAMLDNVVETPAYYE